MEVSAKRRSAKSSRAPNPGTDRGYRSKRLVKIIPQERQLIVLDSGYELDRFPLATARYGWVPKFWSNDYRNPLGSYKVAGIFTKDMPALVNMNAHYVPWYLSPTAHDPYEDAGSGIYGVGMVTLDYPNWEDLKRYEIAKRNGELERVWRHFCENHFKPIYDYIAVKKGIPSAEVRVETDYGNSTYADLLESSPIQDPNVAFQLGVALHGTSDPACIGTSISAGCLRMHNDSILKLISMVEVGTEIVIEETSFYSM